MREPRKCPSLPCTPYPFYLSNHSILCHFEFKDNNLVLTINIVLVYLFYGFGKGSKPKNMFCTVERQQFEGHDSWRVLRKIQIDQNTWPLSFFLAFTKF